MVVARRRVVPILFVLVSLALLHVPTAQAERPPSIPYLALGDSLPYGWDIITDGLVVPPDSHVGYPEVLAARSPLEVTNASCPGETSGSFLDAAAQDNGCDEVREGLGLKTDWGDGTQMDFALAFLAANPDTGLVTLQLGANDLFLCQERDEDDGDTDSPGECTPQEFAQVLTETGQNLAVALATLRTVHDGPIVLVSYYSLDYTDPTQTAISQASRDLVLEPLAAAFGDDVVVADGFGAFEQASRRAGGDTCAAGLLLPLGDGRCDVHTTPTGDRVLARAVHRAIDLGEIVDAGALGSRAR